MADFFLDEPVAAAPPAAADPAADFLAEQQSDLAALDGNVYDQVPQQQQQEGGFAEIGSDNSDTENTPEEAPQTQSGDFDPFGGAAQTSEPPAEELDFIQQATVVESAPVEPEPTPAAPPVVPSYTMPKIEPEIIKQWREDFKARTEKIEADAQQEADEWKTAAREALDKFYADRDEKMSKTRSLNRESASALAVENETFNSDGMESQEKWEHVTQSIDFNAKGSCTKDTSRMRQVLLQLKSGQSAE